MESLPPCSQKTLKAFLTSKGWNHDLGSSDKETEIWFDKDDFSYVSFKKAEDPIPFPIMIAIIEIQMSMKIPDLPFYAKEIAQRFSEG